MTADWCVLPSAAVIPSRRTTAYGMTDNMSLTYLGPTRLDALPLRWKTQIDEIDKEKR
jgi:hypothetical protein